MHTWLYRHDEILTHRPYAFDVDDDGWLWEGAGGNNRLAGHHLSTAELVQHVIPEMGGRPVFSAFAWQGKLVLVLGEAPYYLVYDLRTRACIRRPIDCTDKAIVWYGVKTPQGKLLLYERHTSNTLILDAPEAEPRIVPFPYQGQLGAGRLFEDGLVYSTLNDPARVVRFDPAAERFVDEIPAPAADLYLATTHLHEGTLYCANTSGGAIYPYHLASRRWEEPIPTPDYGTLYGYIGASFTFQGKAYINLSTYAHPSRLDPATGKLIIPDGPTSVDGRPYRFLDRFLVFDAATHTFDYLTCPAQPDGVPLLCYAWTDGERFAITGYVIPFAEPGEPGEQYGHWLVLQNRPADAEPGFRPYDLHFDRAAHLAPYRRGYHAARSLYLPEEPWTPPIRNLRGPATQYLPGREAEILRRAAKTDAAGYFTELARQITDTPSATTDGAGDDAERVRRVAEFVNQALYYNPIQVLQSDNPVAILESHDARCGQGVLVTRALLDALGIPNRATPLNHHVVAEACYDGGWHLVDALFFSADQPQRDGRVLSVEELLADPYFADAWPQQCFAYDPELLTSEDGFNVQGYVFGPWGSEPYYSYYLYGPKAHPPTLPVWLPARARGERPGPPQLVAGNPTRGRRRGIRRARLPRPRLPGGDAPRGHPCHLAAGQGRAEPDVFRRSARRGRPSHAQPGHLVSCRPRQLRAGAGEAVWVVRGVVSRLLHRRPAQQLCNRDRRLPGIIDDHHVRCLGETSRRCR